MENKTLGSGFVKGLLLFLAEKISASASSIGFAPRTPGIVILRNSREDVLEKIADIFSEIEFCADDAVAISGMPVPEAKRCLNAVAAFLSGRHGIIGPLSFPLGEADACLLNGMKAKIVRINRGAVRLDELRSVFGKMAAAGVDDRDTEASGCECPDFAGEAEESAAGIGAAV